MSESDTRWCLNCPNGVLVRNPNYPHERRCLKCNPIPEAELMRPPAMPLALSLPIEDWEWLLECLASRYYDKGLLKDMLREAWLVGLLQGKFFRQKAALKPMKGAERPTEKA